MPEKQSMRDQRFTAMANALIVPVRVKDETVPMVKPDSRRASVHYQQAEDGLEFQEDYEEPEDGALGASPGARSEMRTTIAQGAQGTRFLVRVDESKAAERRRTKMVRETDGSRRLLEDTEATRSVRRLGQTQQQQQGSGRSFGSGGEDLRITRDFANPQHVARRDGKRRESTTFSHRYESVDMKKAMLHNVAGTVPFDMSELRQPVTMSYDAAEVLPSWIVRHVDYSKVDQIIKEERLREALTAQPIIRTDKQIQLIDRFLVQVWPTAQRIGEARVSQATHRGASTRLQPHVKRLCSAERGSFFYSPRNATRAPR